MGGFQNGVRNIRWRKGKGQDFKRWEGDVEIYRFFGEGEKDKVEPKVCEAFGCGHHLSPQEQLFSTRCPKHNKKETTLSVIDKHLSL